MTAIYKREFKSYFQSMIGYVFIAFLIAFTGVYFMVYNLNYGHPYFSYTLSGVLFIFIMAIPVLTMRSFAEDAKSKTDQLLLTAPVSLFKIVMGKFLAMISVLAIPCAVYLLFPLIIKAQGSAHIVVDYCSILTFFLLGATYIAIGMFVSSLTQSQIIAAIGTCGLLVVTYLWNAILNFLPKSAISNMIAIVVILSLIVFAVYHMTRNWLISGILEVIVVAGNVIAYVVKSTIYESALSNILTKLDLTKAFDSISSNSLFDVSGIVLYLSAIGLFIFLTMQMIQKRRWS